MKHSPTEWVVGIGLALALLAVPFFGLRARYNTEASAVASLIDASSIQAILDLDQSLAAASGVEATARVKILIAGVQPRDVPEARYPDAKVDFAYAVYGTKSSDGTGSVDILVGLDRGPKSDLLYLGFRPLPVVWYVTGSGTIGVASPSEEPFTTRISRVVLEGLTATPHGEIVAEGIGGRVKGTKLYVPRAAKSK